MPKDPQPSPVQPSLIDLTGVELTLPSIAGPVEILRGIDLSIAHGETVSIVGPSGSGKTSLIMVIAGLERASAGQVAVAGRTLAELDEDKLALFRRDTLGIVFQDFHLVPTMTALENVAVPLELAGRADAFERAAVALTAVISDPESVSADEAIDIKAEAPDLELLLVDWLNALIYEMAARKMLFSRFQVAIDGTHLRAVSWGEPVNIEKHRPAVEVKGATYTGLRVVQDKRGEWVAECVVDV